MDVILRNDPSLMDFQSYNEFTSDDVYDSEIFVEGAIGDKLKKAFNALIRFIKNIIDKIRGYFASRRVAKYKAMIDDPEIAKELKEHKDVLKWDTELNKRIFEIGTETAKIALNAIGDVIHSHSLRGIDRDITNLNRKRVEIEALVKKTQQRQDPNQLWSEYDAICAVLDETTTIGAYEFVLQNLYDLMKAHSAGKLDTVYGNDAGFKSKMEDLMVETYSALKPIDEAIFYVSSRYKHLAQNAGRYIARDLNKNIRKQVGEKMKDKYGKSGGTYIVTGVHKEYYTGDSDDMSLDELDAYIEYAMDDLSDALELRNRLIQESDDVDTSDIGDDGIDSPDTVQEADWWNDDEREIFRRRMHLSRKKKSQSGLSEEDKKEYEANAPKYFDLMKRTQERASQSRPVKESYTLDGSAEYYSDAIVRNYNEPVQENKTYCLKTNDMFITESYDEPSGPDRFVQEYNPDTKAAVLGGILGFAAHDTLLIAGITTDVMLIVKGVDSIIASATYKKKYGRFAADMKAVMDILKESKDGTIKTGRLNKALYTLRDDCDTISGKGIISRKAMVNLTATERSEIKQLSTIIKDLERMLTSKPNKAAERRIPARIEDFVKKCETVTKLLNRGKNPGDVVKEYMS